jgi:4-cresol dehydrogenase (hydroxylating) flavoprotein subunit
VPLDGASVAELARAAEGVFRAHGFPLYMTFNTIARDAAECVLTLIFDRTVDGETMRAQRCIDSMTGVATRLGYPPYRLNIQSMDCAAKEEIPFWQVVESLKEVFDPDHVIAPGRYNRV